MLIRIVILFLVVMVAMALLSGPGLRRLLMRWLGLGSDRD